MKYTQAQLAEKIGRDHQAIGRYERQECNVSEQSAKALAALSGYIEEYWLGLTECKYADEYSEEIALSATDEDAETAHQRKRTHERIKSLLGICGFGYEDFLSGRYDFIDFSNDVTAKADHKKALENNTPNKIIDYSKRFFDAPVFLSDEALTEMVQNIRSTIGYACYREMLKNK